MGVKALIIVGGGGWGREALEILPHLDPSWERHFLVPWDAQWWWRRNAPDTCLHVVPKMLPDRPTRGLLLRSWRAVQAMWSVVRVVVVMCRVRPEVILGIGSDLSLPCMGVGRLFGSRHYYVESLTRVRRNSRTSRLLSRLRLVDYVFVQHPELAHRVDRGVYVGGIL